MGKPERVRDAPGLIWKARAGGVWQARWQCRTDILAKGFKVKSVKLWEGTTDPDKATWDFIAETCRDLQNEMLDWSRGESPKPIKFDGRTLSSLMDCYKTDPDSPYKALRHASRVHYNNLMRLIKKDYGQELVADINARIVKRWYEGWSEGGKTTIGHAKVGMLRILFNFGLALLENKECERLALVLSKMKFKNGGAREEALTFEQAVAIRAKAHEVGRPSIALAQAFQFELMLRQKDVIGEWVPLGEPVMSDLIFGDHKWIRGLRWEEIDSYFFLKHTTSKRQKKLSVNLRNAPMVMEELEYVLREFDGKLPANGPIIRNEYDGHPFDANEFRRQWRILANACGIPKEVRNMDSRAGAATEADDAEADIDDIRESATHSSSSMTRRYIRNKERKIQRVQLARLAVRNKTETK